MKRWAKRSGVRKLGPLVASLASFLLIVIASYFFAGLLADVAFAGMPRGVGYVLVSIAQVIRQCARQSGWQRSKGGWHFDTAYTQPFAPNKRRGIGFAAAFKNIGFSFGVAEQSSATIELHGQSEIDEAMLHYAGAEVGQGLHTILTQMTAEAAGVPTNKVRLKLSDTLHTEDSGSASASRLTFMAGHAVQGAAEEARAPQR